MAAYTEETKRALAIGAAATSIVKTLDPLSARAKKRILMYFSDLVQDPSEDGDFGQLEILREVAKTLGINDSALKL